MAAVTGGVALALTAVSTVAGIQQQQSAGRAARRSAREQERAGQEQRAAQHQERRAEQREQIRQERIRRAQIQQAAANTGTSGSSGELGALSSLSTQFGGNMGTIAGMAMRADNISMYNQNAANYMTQSNQNMANANLWGQIGSLSSSAFSATGGFSSLSSGLGTSGVNSAVYSGNLNTMGSQQFNSSYRRTF